MVKNLQQLINNSLLVVGFLLKIFVVFLWSVSIDQAYLNVLVISKWLGQSILGMRQLPLMNILVLKKDWLRQAQKKICVFTVTRPTLIFASDPMNFYTEFG